MSKIVIIGTGAVGSATAYAMALGRTCNELVLIDYNAEKAQGEAIDINHALPFLSGMKLYAGDYKDCKDADIIVLTAGVGRKPGESRLDLAAKNVSICKEIIDNVMEHYNGGVFLIATNPVDVVTALVQKWTKLPKGKVIGTGTTLDTIRLRHELATLFNIDPESAQGYVLGEHGDSQFISWQLSNISGVCVDDYAKTVGIDLNDELKAKIYQDVKTGGATVIKKKGYTNSGIAVCIATLAKSILEERNTIYTVGTMLEGMYGIDGVALSVLSVVGKDGVVKQIECPLCDKELELLRHSAKQIKEILDGVS